MRQLILILSTLLILVACGIKSPTDALNEELDKLELQLSDLKGQRKQTVIEVLGEPDETKELVGHIDTTKLVYQFDSIRADLILNQDVFESYYLSYVGAK